jgi:hypothetical protein
MNEVLPNGAVEQELNVLPIHWPDFDVSWAGPNPNGSGFCFGSDEGSLRITDEVGRITSPRLEGSLDSEAINAVAGWKNYRMVTTRGEMDLWPLPDTAETPVHPFTIPHGAHDVIATAYGRFIAPIGQDGIMTVTLPPVDDKLLVAYHASQTVALDYYRLISLVSKPDEEVLACATRQRGVAATKMRFPPGRNTLITHNFEGLDVVDISPIGGSEHPHAAVAVGRDGTLILFKDVFAEADPPMLRFDAIQGTAYRLLGCRGDLFLLTSDGVYVVAGLASRFMAGTSNGAKDTPILRLPMEAVDANLCGDRWLLVVRPNDVLRIDVGEIQKGAPSFKASGRIPEYMPRAVDLKTSHSNLDFAAAGTT